MYKNKFLPLVLFCLSSMGHGQLSASDRHSLASIELQAESFLAAYPYNSPYPAQFELASLDQRLNLKPCAEALDINFTRADKVMGNSSLNIHCKSPVKWQIHLPVKVAIYDDVIVNKTPLVKGQRLSKSNISYVKKDISRLSRGFFRRTSTLKDLQAKRHLAANTILNSSNLVTRQLIKTGQKVTIQLNFKGLQIKSSGIALQSASHGQIIKVRNTSSNKIVEGIVSAEGQISVNL